jgi:hypothetical protein
MLQTAQGSAPAPFGSLPRSSAGFPLILRPPQAGTSHLHNGSPRTIGWCYQGETSHRASDGDSDSCRGGLGDSTCHADAGSGLSRSAPFGGDRCLRKHRGNGLDRRGAGIDRADTGSRLARRSADLRFGPSRGSSSWPCQCCRPAFAGPCGMVSDFADMDIGRQGRR